MSDFPTRENIFSSQQQQQENVGKKKKRIVGFFPFPFTETASEHSVFDDPLASNEQESAEADFF